MIDVMWKLAHVQADTHGRREEPTRNHLVGVSTRQATGLDVGHVRPDDD